MSNFTIANGCNVPVNVQTGTIPNMGGALLDYMQQMTFTRITKSIVAFREVETSENINFWGVVQPLSGRQLEMKPEGQRKWNWISVHAQNDANNAVIDLAPDEIIIYLGIQYRVMSAKDYSNFSYSYYELVEDYTGEGPPTP